MVPEGLGSLERGDMMMKLREALIATDSENVHTGAAVRQGDPGTQILRFAKRCLPMWLSWGLLARNDRRVRWARDCDSRRAFRLSGANRAHGTANRSVKAGVFKQILCAVGLAPSSVSVIRQALSLAWETHGHVKCVCVMTEPSPSASEIRTQILAAIPPKQTRGATLKWLSSRECQPLRSSESPRPRTWTSS